MPSIIRSHGRPLPQCAGASLVPAQEQKKALEKFREGRCLTGKGRAKDKCRACGCIDKNSSENGKGFCQVSPEVGPVQVNTWLGKSEALPSHTHSSVRQIPGAFVLSSPVPFPFF